MKIIDSHTHIYPERIADKASQSIADFYEMPVRYNGTIASLLDICARNNVSKCVVCSVATSAAYVKTINDFIATSVTEHATKFIGLCALHPDMSENEIYDEISRARELGLRGIKLHPDIQRFKINDPKVYKIYAAAEALMPILFHTGDRRYEYSEPAALAEVLRIFPKLTAIGAHFGGWSVWEDVHCLFGFENFYIDTSSTLTEISVEQARGLIESFGSERVLFGTDYPMWDAGGEIALIDKLDLSDSARELIFYRNAERVWG